LFKVSIVAIDTALIVVLRIFLKIKVFPDNNALKILFGDGNCLWYKLQDVEPAIKDKKHLNFSRINIAKYDFYFNPKYCKWDIFLFSKF
jgi:hypothetical protein